MRSVRILAVFLTALALAPRPAEAREKLDPALAARSARPSGSSRILLSTVDGGDATMLIRASGGIAGRRLASAGAQAGIVPDSALAGLAVHPRVRSIRLDRPVSGAMVRTAATVGASWVREQLGFDGSGVGVAVIDSGVANWHDDLGSDAVVHFVDFVGNLPLPHDDYGHGTHVAGTIAGTGYDSGGARRGVAPGARLVVLKVLEGNGDGHISNVIAAIDYAIEHRARFNIRVINLSVSSGVYESYLTDPLTLAARRAVEAGIVVVTAAGNLGRDGRGRMQHGGITSPGNAPWVITVGAGHHQGTAARGDDTVATFSSRGPTHIDRGLKPDVVAPGVSIESLAAPGSALYTLNPDARIRGTVDTAHAPYISLTGTSMAAPVVTGTIALMIEANPALTPNLVKAILHYTAERRPRVDSTAQGAGFLNARGAVQLAMALADEEPGPADPTRWSRQIIWGDRRVTGGVLTPDANAWATDVIWGAPSTAGGERIAWGRLADSDEPWTVTADAGSAQSRDDPVSDVAWSELEPVPVVWASSTNPTAASSEADAPATVAGRRWWWLLSVR